MNQDNLIQNPPVFLLPPVCLSRVIRVSVDTPENCAVDTEMHHSDLPLRKALLPSCPAMNSGAATAVNANCQLALAAKLGE